MRVVNQKLNFRGTCVKQVRCWVDKYNVIRAIRSLSNRAERAGLNEWTIGENPIGITSSHTNTNVVTYLYDKHGQLCDIKFTDPIGDLEIDGITYDINGDVVRYNTHGRRIVDHQNPEQDGCGDTNSMSITNNANNMNVQQPPDTTTAQQSIKSIQMETNNSIDSYNDAIRQRDEYNKRLDKHNEAYYNLTASMIWTRYLDAVASQDKKSPMLNDFVAFKSWEGGSLTNTTAVAVAKLLREKRSNESGDWVGITKLGENNCFIRVYLPSVCDIADNE